MQVVRSAPEDVARSSQPLAVDLMKLHVAARRSLLASIVISGVFCLWVAPASAQDCGNWPYPVLCTADLVLTDGSFDRRTLGGETSIGLAPRGEVELELDGRDQRGRYFPGERLALDYDDRDCGSMLRVEDLGEGRVRVEAAATQGSCTLEIFAPNNLNFRWLLEVEISAAARVRYSRTESEFLVRALYLAILNREPDPGGFSLAVTEIEGGNLEGQIEGMLRYAPFRGGGAGWSPEQILEQFYQGILGREADSGGVRVYLGEMRRGQYASVLLKLIRSPEFERRLQR